MHLSLELEVHYKYNNTENLCSKVNNLIVLISMLNAQNFSSRYVWKKKIIGQPLGLALALHVGLIPIPHMSHQHCQEWSLCRARSKPWSVLGMTQNKQTKYNHAKKNTFLSNRCWKCHPISVHLLYSFFQEHT